MRDAKTVDHPGCGAISKLRITHSGPPHEYRWITSTTYQRIIASTHLGDIEVNLLSYFVRDDFSTPTDQWADGDTYVCVTNGACATASDAKNAAEACMARHVTALEVALGKLRHEVAVRKEFAAQCEVWD